MRGKILGGYAVAALCFMGCDSESSGPKGPGEPPNGSTSFASADTQGQGANGLATGGPQNAGTGGSASFTPAPAGADQSSGRTVERGDIYRVLADQRILNLNAFRGLQVIDVSDVNAPHLEGRLAVEGTPVELYVVGDRAIVLFNDWRGYYGSRDDVKVESVEGGLVMTVDLHDRAHPTLVDRVTVPGYIQTSRLTQGGGQAALYVASTSNDANGSHAVVKSFDVSGTAITPKTELDLGGYVNDIQATDADILLVASYDYQTNQANSLVSVIDISRPDGSMVQGATIRVQGIVQNKFSMDAYNGVLRVVSGAGWNGAQQNHLQTFSLSDLQNPTQLDDCVFGNNNETGTSENLFATIFLQNRGFFVTYFRKDPFHSFSIDDQGKCQEHNEFIVSGWNDFLRPTLNDSRLVGVGRNDENSTNKLSVSLYDATNLTNPNPLLARADIDLTWGYSEAQWDDRGFSVIENAVSAQAADGTAETGLILLPYEGYDNQAQSYAAQVQIFTFSDRTLTRRGTMDHGSAVRRSFLAQPGTAANLSEEQLSLFDTNAPDSPKELGRTDVAPNYTKLLVFGDHVVRLRDRSYYFYGNGSQGTEVPKSHVEVLPRSADLDGSAPVASFEVPSGADLIKVGNLLVSVLSTYVGNSTDAQTPQYHSIVGVFDLSDPKNPAARGSFETDRLQPGYGGYGGYGGYYPSGGVAIDCFGRCGYYGGYSSTTNHHVVGQAIAFAATKYEQQSLGMVRSCYGYAPGAGCSIDSSGAMTCPEQTIQGGINCTTPVGGVESCTGSYYLCNSTGECTPTKEKPPGVIESCSDYENFRSWQSYSFDVLDLRNPDAPVLTTRLEMPTEEEGSSVLADGNSLYFNYQVPYTVAADGHPYVRHYFRRLDVADPSSIEVGNPVNVPGDVIAVDGSTIYARDLVWGDTETRTMVSRLTVNGGLAYMQANRLFPDTVVSAVELDGAGHMLVSSDPAWNYAYAYTTQNQPMHKLSILDAQSLEVAGEAEVDQWATFKDARGGRALFQVSGGLLVFDVRDAKHPVAQAYFPTLGWPNDMYFDGGEILFAAGPYGVYRFDASAFNLLSKN